MVWPPEAGTIVRVPDQPLYDPGTQVSLSAQPTGSSWTFAGWRIFTAGGDSSPSGQTISVTVNSSDSVEMQQVGQIDTKGYARSVAVYGNLAFVVNDPINPGDEAASWKRFNQQAFDKFIDGKFSGDSASPEIISRSSHASRFDQ